MLIKFSYNDFLKKQIGNAYENIVKKNLVHVEIDHKEFLKYFFDFHDGWYHTETPIMYSCIINNGNIWKYIEEEYDYYYDKDGNLKK